MLNNVIGAKFKMVLGYGGSSEAMLAMERGEVEGHSTATRPINPRIQIGSTDKKVNFIVQYGLSRHPDLPDVPTCVELARNDEKR